MTKSSTVILAGAATVAVMFSGGVGCQKGAGGAGGAVNPGADVVEKTDVHLDLPNVPEFAKIAVNPEGHSVTEMRRLGAKYLTQSVKVKGYVVWKYDCIDLFMKEYQAQAAVEGKPLTEADARKLAEKQYCDSPPPKGVGHRERCDKPHFYIADEPNASSQKSIWIVDVPRNPEGKQEEDLAKDDPASWPAAPIYAVGDQVVVEGKWETKSPKGFINLGGLVVYSGFTNLTTPPDPDPKAKPVKVPNPCKDYK